MPLCVKNTSPIWYSLYKVRIQLYIKAEEKIGRCITLSNEHPKRMKTLKNHPKHQVQMRASTSYIHKTY